MKNEELFEGMDDTDIRDKGGALFVGVRTIHACKASYS